MTEETILVCTRVAGMASSPLLNANEVSGARAASAKGGNLRPTAYRRTAKRDKAFSKRERHNPSSRENAYCGKRTLTKNGSGNGSKRQTPDRSVRAALAVETRNYPIEKGGTGSSPASPGEGKKIIY